jgi:protein tyrosine phosphatase
MEYRVLMRISCHLGQFNNLFRDPSADFRRRNRYNDILPFKHNMVRVEDETEGRFNWYYNASYINVTRVTLITS